MQFMTDERVVVLLSILMPAMWWFQECGSPGLEGKKDGSCDVARNLKFSICKVADSFLEAGDMCEDIAAEGELLGQLPEP